MTKPAPIRRPACPSEEGFILLAVILLLALFTIALAVALPNISKQIQRDREIETMHRGLQYARAVKLYYQQFGAYPPNVDALVKTSNVRFLRKKYTDPMTGKDDWKPVLFGQNKAPTAMGFFGQPLAGSTIAGTGPSGGNGIAGTSSTGGSSLFGSDSEAGSADASAGSAAGSTGSSSGGSTATTGSGSDGAGASSGSTGQTFGGVGMIGFSPGSPKQSILVYKKKDHYNQWEFVYDPLADQMMQGGNTGTIGQPASSLSGSTATGGSSTFGGSLTTGVNNSSPSTTSFTQ
jgi:type II secretory pathway pseudopilin PulG